MKICERVMDFIQVIDANGGVRVCGWNRNNYIGSLLENTMEEIYAGEKSQAIRKKMAEGNYEDCNVDNCPWLANGTISEHLLDVEEAPKYPKELYLAYEGICNYHCTCCSSHGNMEQGMCGDWNKNYDIIEERLREVLPHVKKIGAHGRGELFASRRIMNILREWKPLAPVEEVSVSLETNGSMFDEKHWKQIDNLGQYYLRVAITVMSFEEKGYQYLSGTKLPITRIEDNLRYVKSLREQGIINELELATVVQERNFRQLPEFVDRCTNEFGADIVRVRPIFLAGAQDSNIEWFADVRNPYHPYHQEYLEVMQHPVLKHPKVLLWSGDYLSTQGQHPGIIKEKQLQNVSKALKNSKQVLSNIDKILKIDNVTEMLTKFIKSVQGKKLSIYGMGRVGKLLVKLCDNKSLFGELYDSKNFGWCFEGIKVIHPDEGHMTERENVILVTAINEYESIKLQLEEKGFKGRIYCLSEVLKEG